MSNTDQSSDASMDEILASIRRIISDEPEGRAGEDIDASVVPPGTGTKTAGGTGEQGMAGDIARALGESGPPRGDAPLLPPELGAPPAVANWSEQPQPAPAGGPPVIPTPVGDYMPLMNGDVPAAPGAPPPPPVADVAAPLPPLDIAAPMALGDPEPPVASADQGSAPMPGGPQGPGTPPEHVQPSNWAGPDGGDIPRGDDVLGLASEHASPPPSGAVFDPPAPAPQASGATGGEFPPPPIDDVDLPHIQAFPERGDVPPGAMSSGGYAGPLDQGTVEMPLPPAIAEAGEASDPAVSLGEPLADPAPAGPIDSAQTLGAPAGGGMDGFVNGRADVPAEPVELTAPVEIPPEPIELASPVEGPGEAPLDLPPTALMSDDGLVEPQSPAEEPGTEPGPVSEPEPEGAPAGAGPAETASEGSGPGSASLEDTVSGLLRPMLRDWLDENMPGIVEKTLGEIARKPTADDDSNES